MRQFASRGIIDPLFTSQRCGDIAARKGLVRQGLIRTGLPVNQPTLDGEKFRLELIAAGVLKPR